MHTADEISQLNGLTDDISATINIMSDIYKAEIFALAPPVLLLFIL